MTEKIPIQAEKFFFASSVANDVWHPRQNARGYEWWYFDAVSDDGKDALVVIFLDNFVFSPRYNKLAQSPKFKVQSSKTGSQSAEVENSPSQIPDPESQIPNFPALAFIYYRNGKPLYRAVNEFASEDFFADTEIPSCRLGDSSFKFESAPYGSGYILSIETALRGRRNLEAHLEWLSIESDFLPAQSFADAPEAHHWNLVAPRSDVTGSVKVKDAKGKLLDVRHFRGTGYHDHNTDARWLPAAVKDWQWGRAHFTDATAVYYRYRECGEGAPVTKLFIVKNNKLEVFNVDYKEDRMRRSLCGVKYPRSITLSTESGIKLVINQTKPIDDSFFYLRFLSEARLECPDADAHESFAITEHLAPKSLKYRWLDWLVSMRIGRNGKGAFLP